MSDGVLICLGGVCVSFRTQLQLRLPEDFLETVGAEDLSLL